MLTLLARAKFILTKHKTKWTEAQKGRAQIIFEHYPTLKKAYDLAMKLTDIYNIKSIKDAARLKLAKWFNEVEELGVDNFYTVIDTFENHYQTILNFFVNRATNANAESFNAKVKASRAQFRGVTDIPFFLYRLMKLGLMVKCTPERGQKCSLFHLMVKCTPIIVELPSVYRCCKPLICFQ